MANEALTGLTPEDMNILKAISLGGGVSFDMPEKKTGYTFADIEDLDVQPARSRSNHIFGMAKDVFDYMSGLDPNAYVGKTAKMTNEYMKTLAEDDPEGKMIDMNRAKVLSQRASETDDVALKKRYGAEIKKLLPRETQGLDDLTASAFLIGDSERLRQQLLKNAGNLAVQQAKNAKDITTTGMKTESNENIANTRAEALRDVANIRGQYDLSKKDKDYLREQLKQEGMNDRQADKLVADYERELMKQEHADYRTAYTADKGLEGRMYTADKNYAGKELQAQNRLDVESARTNRILEQEKIKQASANMRALVNPKGGTSNKTNEKQAQADRMFEYYMSPQQLAHFDELNRAAGQTAWGGNWYHKNSADKKGSSIMAFEAYVTGGIMSTAKSLGSNPSDKDAERTATMFGLNTNMHPDDRKQAWLDALQYIAAVSGSGLPLSAFSDKKSAMEFTRSVLQSKQAYDNVGDVVNGSNATGQTVLPNGNVVFNLWSK